MTTVAIVQIPLSEALPSEDARRMAEETAPQSTNRLRVWSESILFEVRVA